MKLNVELDALWQCVREMGAESIDADLGLFWENNDLAFDYELSGGRDIELKDVKHTQGLLSVRGRQVVLFIPDQGDKYSNVIDDPYAGTKFHIAECKTLNKLRQSPRFHRLKVTTDISGEFPIYGRALNGTDAEAVVRLYCCQNCLKLLNYKGAASLRFNDVKALAGRFDIGEFFSTYGSLFKSLPQSLVERNQSGYTADWPALSQSIRQAADYTCANCLVRLDAKKALLHVHHLNGHKADNSSTNLIPLCADCHRKQPYHEHMHVKHQDIQRINHFRREQGLIDSADWEKVIQFVDPALLGVLNLCKARKMTPPEVGYEVVNKYDEVVAELEIAWPEQRLGVVLAETPTVSGWTLMDLQGALAYFGKKA